MRVRAEVQIVYVCSEIYVGTKNEQNLFRMLERNQQEESSQVDRLNVE